MTAPSSKELGQTTDPQELVPGNTEHIEASYDSGLRTRLTTWM